MSESDCEAVPILEAIRTSLDPVHTELEIAPVEKICVHFFASTSCRPKRQVQLCWFEVLLTLMTCWSFEFSSSTVMYVLKKNLRILNHGKVG